MPASGTVSDEPDYLSWSAGGASRRTSLNKNVTLLLGYGHGHDVAGRTGHAVLGLLARASIATRSAARSRWCSTRRPSRSLLGDVGPRERRSVQAYRYIPLFAPGTSVPRGASIDVVNACALRAAARAAAALAPALRA